MEVMPHLLQLSQNSVYLHFEVEPIIVFFKNVVFDNTAPKSCDLVPIQHLKRKLSNWSGPSYKIFRLQLQSFKSYMRLSKITELGREKKGNQAATFNNCWYFDLKCFGQVSSVYLGLALIFLV